MQTITISKESYDKMIADIKASTDPAERFELMHKAEDMIMSTGAICITLLSGYSGMTDGSGMTHRKCRGAHVRLMPTVWAH